MPKKEILKKKLKSLTESKTQQLRSIQQITQDILQLKTGLVTDPTNPLKNNDLKYLTDTVGKLLKTFDGIHDEKIDDETVEDDASVVADNEGSEGHGKMPGEVEGLGESVISLSEETLKNVIRRVVQERVIKEQSNEGWEGPVSHDKLMVAIDGWCVDMNRGANIGIEYQDKIRPETGEMLTVIKGYCNAKTGGYQPQD